MKAQENTLKLNGEYLTASRGLKGSWATKAKRVAG
jgi:hypothetical protein